MENDDLSQRPAAPPPTTQSAQRVAGGLLMGCGIIFAGLSGLCTLLVAGSALMESGSQDAQEILGMIPAVLIFGGAPVAIGVGMFFLGRYLLKTGQDQ